MTDDDDFYDQLRKHQYQLATWQFEISAIRLGLALKAGFRPDQPRVPRGHPDGGQWTDNPRWVGEHDGYPANANMPAPFDGQLLPVGGRGRIRRGQVRIGNRWVTVTPAQRARLVASRLEMESALLAVRRVDPRWRPRPQAYETVEGEIEANFATTLEARIRLQVIARVKIGPGPFAHEWIMAPSSNRRLTNSEQKKSIA